MEDAPLRDALTAPVFHLVKITGKRPERLAKSNRATSGGRPILSNGQAWPTCGYCNLPLGLYLQFDLEERFQLVFQSGSHVLLFNCVHCDAIPEPPPGDRVPAAWLDPTHEQSYRLILNRPRMTESIHPPDPVVREQSVVFDEKPEVISPGLDGPVGVERFKVGGVPHWLQPPRHPRCSCGARMEFVLQVPASARPSWRFGGGSFLPFCADLDVFAFACSAQCSPYAAALIAER